MAQQDQQHAQPSQRPAPQQPTMTEDHAMGPLPPASAPHGYEWVQDGNLFVLIAIIGGIIAKVFLNSMSW